MGNDSVSFRASPAADPPLASPLAGLGLPRNLLPATSIRVLPDHVRRPRLRRYAVPAFVDVIRLLAPSPIGPAAVFVRLEIRPLRRRFVQDRARLLLVASAHFFFSWPARNVVAFSFLSLALEGFFDIRNVYSRQ